MSFCKKEPNSPNQNVNITMSVPPPTQNIPQLNKRMNNHFEQNTEFLNNLNNFFKLAPTDISHSNDYLCNQITWENSQNFIYSILNPVMFQIKWFSCNALLHLFTYKFTEININQTQTIFDSLINYLFQYRNLLFEEQKNNISNIDVTNEKLFMKTLIKLISRIIRVYYPQCNYFKRFVDIIERKSMIYNKDSNSIKILSCIYTEVIYQFQTNFGLSNYTIQMSKHFNLIEEFRDSCLIIIFASQCGIIDNLLNHKIQTENFDDMLSLTKQVSLCMLECLDYSDDINAKEDDYNKYEIKPTYIPSQRKRGKDKKLNINELIGLCQNLFDLYNMIVKTFLAFNGNLEKSKKLKGDYYKVSENILKILKKLICMKIQYLDINKGRILKNYTTNLGGILLSQHGFIHHDCLCQIIYRLKKNYSYQDLITINDTFWSLITPFMENSIKKISENNNNNQEENYLSGTLYLLRFFGYFSHNLNKIETKYQLRLKNQIISICKQVISLDFKKYAYDIDDITKNLGCCAEGVFSQILDEIVKLIKEYYTKMDLLNICFQIRFGIEIIKNNYDCIQEKILVNKESDNELESLSDMDLSDDTPGNKSIVNYIRTVFDLIKEITKNKSYQINLANFVSQNKNNENNIGLFSKTLLKFIKFFSNNFLNKYLNNTFTFMISSLLNYNNHNNNENCPEELIIFIIDILMQFNINTENSNINQLNYTNEDKLSNNEIIKKILNIISNNFAFETDYSNKIFPLFVNYNINNNSSICVSPSFSSKRGENNEIEEISQNTDKNVLNDSFKNNNSLNSTPKGSINNLNNNIDSELLSFMGDKLNENLDYSKNFIINETPIHSIDIHLGKLRLNQNKFVNVLKDIFDNIISLDSKIFPIIFKLPFLKFLFKIFFQCYLPFEKAISYFINELCKINTNDFKDFIYIMNAMISSVTTRDNYQILIKNISPSIQAISNTIINNSNNKITNENFICLKKYLKLIKDIIDYENFSLRNFDNNSQCPIQLFGITGNILDYYIKIASGINLQGQSDSQVYSIQIKPISYIIKIYYNLFNHYIQVPLFINTNYSYMQNLFYKLAKLIFTISNKNFFGYCENFKELPYLLKVIYCDYITANHEIITNNNINNNNINDNNYICDLTYINQIINIFWNIIDEEYNNNEQNNINSENIGINTKSAENIRKCFRGFNDIIYEWCKLYITMNLENNNTFNNSTKNTFVNKIVEISNNNIKKNDENGNNSQNKTLKTDKFINNNLNSKNIISSIFTENNINIFLNKILASLLKGLLLSYYSTDEIYNDLSKTIFILGYSFQNQYISIFNNLLSSNSIKSLYNDEEIEKIKTSFSELNNNQNYDKLKDCNNDFISILPLFYDVYRDNLKDFVKNINKIIMSRRNDLDDNENILGMQII